jgi:hypothetical protein
VSVIYICCWASPAQSFSGLSSLYCCAVKVRGKVILRPRSESQSVLVSGHHLVPATNFSFLLHWHLFRQLLVSCYEAPSLTREWVCNLLVQLLLGFASVVALGSNFRRRRHHNLLSHVRLLQPGGPDHRIYIPQEQGGPFILPGILYYSVLVYYASRNAPERETHLLTVSIIVSVRYRGNMFDKPLPRTRRLPNVAHVGDSHMEIG